MQKLVLEATKSTPAVVFDPDEGVLSMKGESYPENAAKFYAPLFAWLDEYLASVEGPVRVDLEIIYFNSSSSKALMNFFDRLEDAASNGRSVTVNWRYHEENETAQECGEEFMEDLEKVDFNLVEITD